MSDKVTAKLVPERSRVKTLPKHFGTQLLRVESAIYSFLRQLSPDYTGGFWQFYELSNGGFYMAPDVGKYQLGADTPSRGPYPAFRIKVADNGYEGEVSADAAGIIACLFAFSHLSFRLESEKIGAYYHLLREYAQKHPEASAIYAAID